MKKVMVMFTGGTIGSKVTNKTIDVDESVGYLLIEKFRERSKLDVEFETNQPLNILSENCTPQDWTKMIQALKEMNMDDLDGIIITHGTDTLPYTSAIISYLFSDTEIPIILTASNYALDQPKSNGIRNFTSSVEFIYHASIPGVFTIYEDEKGVERVYLSSRIIEADPFNDQFASFGGTDLGYLKDGILMYNKSNINPNSTELVAYREPIEFEKVAFDNKILAIRPYPGLDYTYFRFDESNKPKAIIHKLYHSSTACIREGAVSLPQFIAYCKSLDIDFYLTSFKNTTEDLYVTSQELLGNGAVPLHNISFEAAIAKLWLAYNMDMEDPEKFINKKIHFEFL